MKTQECLKSVDIAGARQILSSLKDQCEEIFEAMENIEALNISDDSVMHLQPLSNMTKIKELKMDNLDTPGSLIFSSLMEFNANHLESWRAKNLAISSKDLVTIINRRFYFIHMIVIVLLNLVLRSFIKLVHLDFSHAAEGVVTDEVVSAICCNLTTLEHLDLSHNVSISDVGTIGLEDKTVKEALKEMIGYGNKISLASR